MKFKVLACLLLMASTCVQASPMEWPTFRLNPAHTAASGIAGTELGDLKWKSQLELASIRSSPAVVDGAVYVGSDRLGKVYALDALTGEQLWSLQTEGQFKGVFSSPAVVGGTVYVGSFGHDLYAINASSSIAKWTFPAHSSIQTSPAVADGRVFVGDDHGIFYAVDATTGTMLWQFETEDTGTYYRWIRSSPVVWNGTVYFGGGNAALYALDVTSGATRWSFSLGHTIYSSPAVAEGKVFVGSTDGKIVALDAKTGQLKWRFTAGDSAGGSPAVSNGTVFISSVDGNVYALNATTGVQKWRQKISAPVSFIGPIHYFASSPAVADGLVYVGSWDSNLYALNASTGRIVSRFTTGDAVLSSPAVVDGTVYFGSDDGAVYAVELKAPPPPLPSPPPLPVIIVEAMFEWAGGPPSGPTTNDTIRFTDGSKVTNATIESWLWDFGDGNASLVQHPSHRYSSPGSYEVTLKVGAGNTSDTHAARITIAPAPLPPAPPASQAAEAGNEPSSKTPGASLALGFLVMALTALGGHRFRRGRA